MTLVLHGRLTVVTNPMTDAPGLRDALPIPPLRLRRIYLQGVGPDGARFDPLDLDFTTRDGAASRVLLSLTNTGGKSTLITLVSSLIVPASRAQVGGKNLGDYILTGDTAHVVCEWEDTTTSTRTVTGTVMEWKDGRRQPGHKQRSTTNMHRVWYLFRTQPGQPGIDELPFLINGRRATFETFTKAVDTLLAPHPGTQWMTTRKQQEWTSALEERTSIDPVLFGYQMRMNDSEAGAEKLLATFDSPDNVVRFFVTALNDDREISDFTAKLRAYADLAVKRDRLEALAAFGIEVRPRIDLIAQRAHDLDEKAATARRARFAGGEHTAALNNRVNQDRKALADLAQAAREAGEDLANVRREYGQISDIRLQLQLETARARLAAADAEVTSCGNAANDAELKATAWEAVDIILDIARARAQRDAAQKAYDAAESGLAPLRNQVRIAAAALAARLEALASEAAAQAELADERVALARAALRRARDAERDANARLAEATTKLTQIDDSVRAADEAAAAARVAGWLEDGERPQQCLLRWKDTKAAAETLAGEENAKADGAEAAFDQVSAQLDTLDGELLGLRSTAQHDRDLLEAFNTELATVSSDETICSLLGGALRDPSDLNRAGGLADNAARDADRRAAQYEQLADAARRELAHLDATGTAPAGPDILAVLKVLIDAGIGVVTGLQWIETNVVDPDSRAGFITVRPDLAGGVVVSDARRFDAATAHLAASGLRTRTPVTVTTAPTGALSTNEHTTRRHVVVPHRATWDRDWAAAVRVELDETAAREGAAAVQAREAATAYQCASQTCSAFTARWLEPRADLAAHAADSASKVSEAEQQRTRLLEDRDGYRDAARYARARHEAARTQASEAELLVTAASELVNTTDLAEAATDRRQSIAAARAEAEGDLFVAKANIDTADTAIEAGIEEAAQLRGAREPWLRERAELDVDDVGSDPGGNVDVLRSVWKTMRGELATAEQGMREAEFLNRAESHLAEMQGRRGRYDQQTLERAEVVAASTAASSRESLIGAQKRARTMANSMEKARLRADAEREQAMASVRAAEPPAPDRQNHADLSKTPEWSPSTPDAIPVLLERLEIRNSELLQRRDATEQAEKDARELHDAVSGDIDAFTDIIGLWSADTVPTTEVFGGPKDAARVQMRTLLRTYRDAEQIERAAQDKLRDAVTAARGVAGDVRWKDLDAPAAVRVRSLPDAALISEANVLATRIHAMADSAQGDLRAMNTHRAILRDGLVSLCREQHRLLREVSRSSRLPAGLGDLSDKPAIKIYFEQAPDDEAAARLATRIDSWAKELADNPKRATSAEVRMRWLADAVRDTVVDRMRAGAWSIEILKPRIDGKVVYCPPDRIPHEFSGGQVLTLAVLVYCALSQVRAAHRQGGARPPGTLILDNPFGAASAETLIEMQHRLAAHSGLQLVCATGLHDVGVDAAFTGRGSVIIKLRNDGDQRRNLSFLRLRSSIVDGIDIPAAITAGRDTTSKTNWVDATRYEVS